MMKILLTSITFFLLSINLYSNRLESAKVSKGIREELKKGDASKNAGNNDSALFYFSRALDISYAEDDCGGKALSYKYLGNLFFITGDYVRAMEYYDLGMKEHGCFENDTLLAQFFNNIGSVYASLKNFDSAEYYFGLGLEKYKLLKDTIGIVTVMQNIVPNFIHNKEYYRALDSFKRIEQYGNINDIPFSHSLYNNLGIIYMRLNLRDSALSLYNKVMLDFEANDKKDSLFFGFIKMHQAELLLEHDSLEASEKNLKEAFVIANKYNSRLLKSYILKLLSLLSERKGILKLALYYEREHNKLVKEMDLGKQESRIKDDQLKKFVKNHERLIASKEIEVEVSKFKLASARKFLIIVSVSLSIVVILFVALIRKNNKLKQAYNNLFKKNVEVIETKNKLREQHEILKNEFSKKENEKEKYQWSLLDDKKKSEILIRIDNIMRKEKIFTHVDITLTSLAQKLEVSRTYLSQVINENYKQNFNNFINEFRVNEASKLLSNVECRNKYTIETIGLMAGFKSKSTFYKSFKQFIGVCPAEFTKQFNLNS